MSKKKISFDPCENCEWLKYRPTAQYEDCSKCIFAAGRSHQAKLDRDAVHELFLKPDMVDFGADEVEVIAALAAAAIVEKP